MFVSPLTLYLDDSTDGAKTFGMVGGYIGFDHHWAEFSRYWKMRLALAKGPAFFHATDFFNGSKGWEAIHRDPARRFRYAWRFAGIVKAFSIVGAARGVDLQAFKQTLAKHPGAVDGTPNRKLTWEMWCVRRCLEAIILAPKPAADYHIAIVLETGLEEAAYYLSWLKKRDTPMMQQFSSVTVGAKRDHLPLQAADFIVYEAMRYVTERFIPQSDKDARGSFLNLLELEPATAVGERQDGRVQVDFESLENLTENAARLEHLFLTNPSARSNWRGEGETNWERRRQVGR